MSDVSTGSNIKPVLINSFFFWVSVGMTATIFIGFITYFQPITVGTLRPISPLVHVHGFILFSWFILLIIQPLLVHRRSVALHRSLGLLGISIGTGVVLSGSIVTIVTLNRWIKDSNPTAFGVMYISILGAVGFAWLFFLAIKNIRNIAAHKRYIILATTTIIFGGMSRVFSNLDFSLMDDYGYLVRYLSTDVWIFALFYYDWKTLGKLHSATIIGGSVNLIPQLLHTPIVNSEAFIQLTYWLVSLAD